MRPYATFLKLTLLVIAAGSISACVNTETKNQPTAAAVPMALPVDVIVASQTAIDQTESIAGTIVPNRMVDVMSELSKKVTAVLFHDGSYVQQGQALYQLDQADILARLRQLQAELNLARINEGRMKELLRTETVRREEYDVAMTKLQSLMAAQDALQVELSKTTIRAPFSGKAGITRVYPGTLVTPGMTLVTIQEQSRIKLRFTVAEKHLQAVRMGNTVMFQTELGTQKFAARITATEAGIDQQSRNLLVEAVADNRNGLLRPGMSAKVFFNTATKDATGIYIPTEALIAGNQGYAVFLIKNGIAKISPVEVQNRDEQRATISAGISNGDTVMVSNLLRAADGTPVSIASTR